MSYFHQPLEMIFGFEKEPLLRQFKKLRISANILNFFPILAFSTFLDIFYCHFKIVIHKIRHQISFYLVNFRHRECAIRSGLIFICFNQVLGLLPSPVSDKATNFSLLPFAVWQPEINNKIAISDFFN